MKRFAVLSFAVLFAVAPSVAGAKEIASAAVCGASGCKQITDDKTLHRLVDGGVEATAPTRAAPYYRLRMKVGGDGHFERVRAYFVPSQRRFGWESGGDVPQWGEVGAGASRLLVEAARGVRPFPARVLQRFVDTSPRAPDDNVVEVYSPAEEAAAVPREDGAGFPWLFIALGSAGVLGAAAVVLARRRLATEH